MNRRRVEPTLAWLEAAKVATFGSFPPQSGRNYANACVAVPNRASARLICIRKSQSACTTSERNAASHTCSHSPGLESCSGGFRCFRLDLCATLAGIEIRQRFSSSHQHQRGRFIPRAAVFMHRSGSATLTEPSAHLNSAGCAPECVELEKCKTIHAESFQARE